jgi:hypothetical protein
MDEDPKATWGVSEALGGFDSGQPIDEKGAESLILAVGRIGGFEEDAG